MWVVFVLRATSQAELDSTGIIFLVSGENWSLCTTKVHLAKNTHGEGFVNLNFRCIRVPQQSLRKHPCLFALYSVPVSTSTLEN